jgi:hypothetical protein
MKLVPGIRSVVVCDDVRQEANRKEILIGVYGGGIRFSKAAPGKLRQLCFRFETNIDATRPFRFQMVSPSGITIIEKTAQMKIEKPGTGILVLTHLDLTLYEAGTYKIMAGFDESIGEVYTIEVSFGEASSQHASEVVDTPT